MSEKIENLEVTANNVTINYNGSTYNLDRLVNEYQKLKEFRSIVKDKDVDLSFIKKYDTHEEYEDAWWSSNKGDSCYLYANILDEYEFNIVKEVI